MNKTQQELNIAVNNWEKSHDDDEPYNPMNLIKPVPLDEIPEEDAKKPANSPGPKDIYKKPFESKKKWHQRP